VGQITVGCGTRRRGSRAVTTSPLPDVQNAAVYWAAYDWLP
jgi:hypothetical protein